MKTKKATDKIKLPKGFSINLESKSNYDDEPYFKDKIAKANQILKIAGIPKGLL